jgi:hypothetical protein
METTLYQVYADAHGAEEAAKQLEGAGVPRAAISMLAPGGSAHMGSFADSGGHQHSAERDRVGSFASGQSTSETPREHMGSFADAGAHEHNAERDRVGSFAAGAFAGELADAGIDTDAAQRIVEQMHDGGVVLIVRADEALAGRASAFLKGA